MADSLSWILYSRQAAAGMESRALALSAARMEALMPWWTFWRRKRQAGERLERSEQTRSVGGRTFTRGIPYTLPSDSEEINRLDFQHYMLRYALSGNYAAPLREPREILDVACGMGRWCIGMAALFPQANVVGIDITPPPRRERRAPITSPSSRPTCSRGCHSLTIAVTSRTSGW